MGFLVAEYALDIDQAVATCFLGAIQPLVRQRNKRVRAATALKATMNSSPP